MGKINVCLYGGKSIFGGKESPLEADEIFCDHADECTFYKSGKCLECRQPFSIGCKFGKTVTTKGYTSRAAKYYTFKRKYESDPVYNVLSYPKELVARIGDTVYIDAKYVYTRKFDKDSDSPYQQCDGYVVHNGWLGDNSFVIPIDDLTNALLYKILIYHPHAMMGGEIEDYQKKVVPEILQGLSKAVPELYIRYVMQHPEHKFEPDYVGKRAYIDSLKIGTIFKDHKGQEWEYRGDHVRSVGEIDLSFGSPWCLSGGSRGMAQVKVTDKMLFTITDNSQVDENTRFE